MFMQKGSREEQASATKLESKVLEFLKKNSEWEQWDSMKREEQIAFIERRHGEVRNQGMWSRG